MKICATFLVVICLITSFKSYGQENYTVLFNTDSYTFTSNGYVHLSQFYKANFDGTEIITLKGHTDNVGSEAYNNNLSKNRVESVSTALQDLGHSKSNLVLNYYGEKEPLNNNQTNEGKANNRRVELSWDKAPEAIVEEEGNIQDLYKLIEPKNEEFCIYPNRDTMLQLKKGTIIFIPANAFNTTSTNCVKFNAREAFSLGDILLDNLSTSSNGRLLETAGMVYTEAVDDNGGQINLNSGKSLTIMIPTDTLRPDMLLFTGNRNSDGNMNWDFPNGRRTALGHLNHGDCWMRDTLKPECERCSFFLCRFGRIDETIKGMVNSEQRAENKVFRACQRKLGPRSRGSMSGLSSDYAWPDCRLLMNQYGVKDYEALMDTLAKIKTAQMQAEFDKYGVDNYEDYYKAIEKINRELKEKHMIELGVTTEQEYQDTLRKIQIHQRRQEFEAKVDQLGDGTSLDDIKYYVAEVNQLGWINCDAFSNMAGRELRTVTTDLDYKPYFDCKIIFKDRKSIMPPTVQNGKFVFARVPKDIAITFFAMKYVNNQAYVYFVETTTSADIKNIKFEAVSKEKLIEILTNLEFQSGS